jgi:4-hydroxy-tetrahydrodipicolinate synthase
MVTPFDEQDRVDYDSACQVADFLIAKGIHCLMLSGTTGEGMLLSVAERKRLCEVVAEYVAGRVPIIAHTGCTSTKDTIELTQHAESAGATAASVITPYFFSFDDESLFDHFVSIASAVPGFPVFLYVFPGNAKNDISPLFLERLLGAASNIVGIKSSNIDLIRLQAYIETGGEDFLTFCGVDGLMLPALTLGTRAQVSGNSNAFPETFCALYDAFVAGDIERARSLQQLINRIRMVLKDGLHPAYFKAALKLREVPAGYVRPPMRELMPEELKEMERGLHELGLLQS